MFDLPIAERELRIGARASATYRSRRNVAAIVLFVFFLLYWNFAKLGPLAVTKIFFFLSNLCLLYSLFAGLILTADCISSEKREGTLGLLFLTALKPRDLVFGNILATSLKAFYGLLAAFPILGLSLLLGGIEYVEFVRICLALLATLLFSLSLSLFISCISQKYLVATGRALLALIFFAVVIPSLYTNARLMTGGFPPRWLATLCLFSPVTTLHFASTSWPFRSNTFWWSLLAVNFLSGVLLLLSCVVLPRVWQDRPPGPLRSPRRFTALARFFSVRSGLRGNPFYWLASRGSLEAVKFLILAISLAILATILSKLDLTTFIGRSYVEFGAPLFIWSWLLVALHLFIIYKIATLATSRLSEDRKLGALELLLVAPITVRQLLFGHWLALLRQLGGAMLGTLFIHALIFWAFLVFSGMEERISGGAFAVLQRLLHALRTDPTDYWHVSIICALILFTAGALCLNWITLACTGTWIALRTRRPTLAPWITLALVFVPPVTVFSLLISGGVRLGLVVGDGFFWAWFCILSGFAIACSHALLLTVWSCFQVVRHFRAFAAERFQPRRTHPLHFIARLSAAAAAVILLVLAFYGEEKWRGLRAWRQLQRDYAAKGQSLSVHLATPPAIPDSENFAAGEILKPLFDYQYDPSGQVLWRDKASRQALMTLTVTGEERYPWRPDTNLPAANWALQKPIDLERWQKFYRTNTTFVCTNDSPTAAVLEALSLYASELAEIEELTRRPGCRFPLHYEEGFTAVWSHLTVLLNLGEVIQLRAAAKLNLGNVAAAREDVSIILRLSDAIATGRGLYPLQIRERLLLHALQIVWEGLSRHAWREEDLQLFIRQFQIDLFAIFPQALRENITNIADFWERLAFPDKTFLLRLGPFPASPGTARIYPTGWKFLNQTRLFRMADNILLPIFNGPTHRVYPSKTTNLTAAIRQARVAFDPVSFTMLPHFNQEFHGAVLNTAHCQSALDQALIACALEQWRQRHGQFPAQLDALSTELPKDVITGKPYTDVLLPKDRFILYSIGWNELDDSGKASPEEKSSLTQNLRAGDWTWQYPEF